MVFVWITTVVSPRWQYCDWVVAVRVTLQELSPNAVPKAVRAAIRTEMMIFAICCLDIIHFVLRTKGPMYDVRFMYDLV